MAQMRMGGMGGHPHPSLARSKSHRSDDNLAGGRLSRRAADPIVEAERRAQQDRQFALDETKVLNGGSFVRLIFWYITPPPLERRMHQGCQSALDGIKTTQWCWGFRSIGLHTATPPPPNPGQ